MITVTGATGQVGSALVARLLELGADVRAVVQPGVEVPWSRAEGLQVVVADFGDLAEMRGAARGADAFFLMSPPGEQQVRWQEIQVEAAQDAQVERVVKLSAFDSSSDTSLTMGRWHWAGEQSLRASGLPHAILRPQYFMENLLHRVDQLRAGVLSTFITPGRPVGMVGAADVADVAAALLTSVDPAGQVVVPTGPAVITTADVADALSVVFDVPVRPDYVDGEQALALLRGLGRPDWHARDTVLICQEASPLVTTDVADLAGHPARDIETVVKGRFGSTATPAG